MSVLLIDAGNTRLKWVWREQPDGETLRRGVVAHRDQPVMEIEAALREDWTAVIPGDVERVWLSSVTSEAVNTRIRSVSEALWSVTPTVIRSADHWQDVTCGYADPSKLGVDRWMVVLAARQRYPDQNCLIIDAGTSVTVDALTADGQHLGGAILPGFFLQQHSLNQDTVNLAAFSRADALSDDGDESLEQRFADNTQSAIELGVYAGIIGAIEWLSREMETMLEGRRNFSVTTLITGGDADRLLAWRQQSWQHHPDLVLDGMALMAATATDANSYSNLV